MSHARHPRPRREPRAIGRRLHQGTKPHRASRGFSSLSFDKPPRTDRWKAAPTEAAQSLSPDVSWFGRIPVPESNWTHHAAPFIGVLAGYETLPAWCHRNTILPAPGYSVKCTARSNQEASAPTQVPPRHQGCPGVPRLCDLPAIVWDQVQATLSKTHHLSPAPFDRTHTWLVRR
jgi:hypothetical protein